MKISIGIPVHNALPKFKKMINSLYDSDTLPHALFICDDASNEATNSYIKTIPAKRIIIHNYQQWFTRSANDLLILSYVAGSDFTFLLNSDIILPKNWMQQLLESFDIMPKVALVGSNYSGKNKGVISVTAPQFVTGHCWCLKTDVLGKVGILDEKMLHIESDREYCHRLNRYGYKTLLDRKTPIKHYGGASWNYDLTKVAKADKHQYGINRPRPKNILSNQEVISRLKDRFKC